MCSSQTADGRMSNITIDNTLTVIGRNEAYEYLTHWGQDKMDAILQTAFSSAFS